MAVALLKPSEAELADYVAALERGWSPDNVRGKLATLEQLEQIRRDPAAFLAGMDDVQAQGPQITLPDGSKAARLPGYVRWIWDDGFCGSIGFRWQPGTSELPAYCLGHVGFAVVPWRQRQGHATQALALLLPEIRARGLHYIEITALPDNQPSQKVILANGGVLHERFHKPAAYGGEECLRFRIAL